MDKFVLIELKDICYYDDDFEYEPFIVKKDKDFEKKYKELESLCENYDDFQDVEDFICDNFEKIEFDKRVIEI